MFPEQSLQACTVDCEDHGTVGIDEGAPIEQPNTSIE